MFHRCVIMAQPLYGYMSAAVHGYMMEFLGINIARGQLHGYLGRQMAYIDDARNGLVSHFIDGYCDPKRPVEGQATHLFFADQDMIFPVIRDLSVDKMDTLGMLLSHDVDVAAGVYFFKVPDPLLVAWDDLGTPENNKKASDWKHPPKIKSDFDPTGLQKVAGVGMGCTLIKADVFRRMEKHFGDREWFKSERGGEDYHFCRRCAELNVDIFLDGRVRCLHVGDHPFGYDNWKVANVKNAAIRRDHFIQQSV